MKKIMTAALVAATALFSACNNGTPKAGFKSDVDTLSYEVGVLMSGSESDFQNMLAQQGSDSAYVDEFLKGFVAGMKSGDDKKQQAYNIGMQAGMSIKGQLPMMEQQVFGGDSTKKFNIKNFIAGFSDFGKDKVVLEINGQVIDKKMAEEAVMAYMFGKQKKESDAYMAKVAKEKGVKPLAEGVYYKEITAAPAGAKFTTTDSVIVKYEGRLANGTVFDSSMQRGDGTVTMNVKQVIKGWQIAIPKMPIGSTWEVYVPYSAGYGERPAGSIPPYSTLIFKITLVGEAK